MRRKTFKDLLRDPFRITIVVLMISSSAIAQNVNVSGALLGNGTYSTLGDAFSAINAGAQTSATITIDIVNNTTETSTAVLDAGAWARVNISPSGGATRTITGSVAGALIDLNGASNVLINGLNAGGNALVISNTSTGNSSTIQFILAASHNTVTNCTLAGSSSDVNFGTVLFSTATAGGNSNNLISNCDIIPAGSDHPANGIVSIGSAGSENQNNTIQNCRISDFFSATLATRGIFISSDNTEWVITGNRFYQSSTRLFTTANTHAAIEVVSGNNHQISNNVIGYASASSTGNYIMGGTVGTRYIAINLAVGTLSASSVHGNTISAITLSTSSGVATTNGIFCAINITSGSAGLTNNIIGGSSGTNLILGHHTSTGALVVGIHSSTTGTLNISGNVIGGLTSAGSGAAIGSAVTGIISSAGINNLSISSNTIGNTTAANMRSGTLGITTAITHCHGIHITTSPVAGAPVVFSNNIIQNFTSNGNNAGGTARGIFIAPTSGSCSYTITNNVITGLTNNNPNPSQSNGQIATAGITMSSGAGNYVAHNTIHNIANLSTSTVAINVCGISTALQASLPMIVYNKIYDLRSASTGTTTTAPPQVTGVFIRSATGSTVTIANNMISLGSGQTNDIAFVGICGNYDSNPNLTRIYYNTINIEGVVSSGDHPSFGFLRGNFAAAKTGLVDIRNNIITNNRTGGSGLHCTLGNSYGFTSSTAGWGAGASNYNVLNTADPANVGWWNGPLNFASWQTTTSGDLASYSGIAVNYVNSASDLHLNMGTTPTFIESGAQVIAGFHDDIDGDTRPGPAGSLNGGGFAPDIGADEFDGGFIDLGPPEITLTPLGGGCSTGDRTLTATIIDYTGVPVTGTQVPMVYYRKNNDPYVDGAGVLASGSSTNGVWSFTLSSAAMGGLVFGDEVSYFVVAQDLAPTPNITSSPSLGLVATDVNAITTPPTNPHSYVISALSGTYTVGAGGNFITLSDAANMYNISCLAGPVTYLLTDALYSTAETFPVTFENNFYASATNSLLIRPAVANSATISGTSNAIIGLIGADYIKVDGSNSGTATRDLLVENLTSTLSTVIYIGNSSNTDAASNINISNCVITGSTGATTTGGIILGSGMVLGGAAEISNNNITIRGNEFHKTQNAVFAIGNATTSDLHWDISNNICGSALDAQKLGFRGIAVQNARLFTVNSNSVIGIKNAVTTTAMAGLLIGAAVSDGTVSQNVVTAMQNTNTTATSGANGIILSSNNLTCNILVVNNMVSDIRGYGGTGVTANNNGNGMVVTAGAGYKIYHNSIWLNSEQGNTAASSVPAAMLVTSGVTAAGAIDLRNNIFVNSQTTPTNRYAIYSAQSNNAIFSNIDYNIYSSTGPNLGFIGSARANLSDLQAGFGDNLNASTLTPIFVSMSDLHLVSAGNGSIDDIGTPLGILVDIDNQTRSTTAPDVGAHEFTGFNCSLAISVAASSASVCQGAEVTFTASGAVSYTWNTSAQTNTLSVNPTASAIYTVDGTDAIGCTATETVNVDVFSLPALVITPASATVCEMSQVSFTASGAATYTWNSNNSLNAAVFTDNPSSNSTFTVEGANTEGCVVSATVGVVTNSLPVVMVSPASLTVCAESLASFTATGADTYTWNNTVVNDVLNEFPTASDEYTVVGATTEGCTSTVTVAVTTLSLPVIVISPPASTLCMNSTETFTASGAVSYTWNTLANTSTISVTATSTDVYTVTGESTEGCLSTAQLTITAEPLPVVNVTPANPTVCVNSSVTFTATGADDFTWSTGPAGNTLQIVAVADAVYTVTGTNSLTGCASTETFAVSTLTVPALVISPSAQSVCINIPVTYTVSGASSYTWQGGSNLNTFSVVPVNNAIYTVTGADQAGCSSTASLSINLYPVTNLSLTASSTTLCVNETVTLTGAGASTYTWLPSNSNAQSFSVTPSATANYVLQATDVYGCVITNSITIHVDECIGIVENSLDVVNVFPNPSSGQVTIDCSFEGTKHIKVLNSLGALIAELTTTESSEKIDLAEKAKGIYFVNVHANGTVSKFKIIVQ